MQARSIRNAWVLGTGTLLADRRLTAIYLGIALLIPFLLFSIHDGSNFRTFMALLVDRGVFIASDNTPWTIVSLFVFSVIGWFGVTMAAWNAMLSPSRDGLIGELMYGMAAGLIAFVVTLAIYMLINLPFTALTVALNPAVQSGSLPAVLLLGVAAVNLMVLLWFNARLCVAGPIMAAAGGINPFPALARSWQLTGPVQWRLLAYLLLFQLAAVVLVGLFLALAVKLIYGTFDFGWQDRVVTIVWMLVELLIVAMLLAVPTGLYRELAGETDVSVFD